MIYAQKEGRQEELYAGYLAGFGPVFYDTLFILKYDNPNILLRLSPFLCLALAVAGRGGFPASEPPVHWANKPQGKNLFLTKDYSW